MLIDVVRAATLSSCSNVFAGIIFARVLLRKDRFRSGICDWKHTQTHKYNRAVTETMFTERHDNWRLVTSAFTAPDKYTYLLTYYYTTSAQLELATIELPNLFIRTHDRIYKSFCCWSNGYVIFHDVTFCEIRRRKGARFLYSPWKMLK